jgi:hypothetical protein
MMLSMVSLSNRRSMGAQKVPGHGAELRSVVALHPELAEGLTIRGEFCRLQARVFITL